MNPVTFSFCHYTTPGEWLAVTSDNNRKTPLTLLVGFVSVCNILFNFSV